MNRLGFSNNILCFLCKFGIGEHAQFVIIIIIMICYTHFPIIMHTITQTKFAIPWTAWKSDHDIKIIVTLLFNDGFETKTKKILLKLLIPSFEI